MPASPKPTRLVASPQAGPLLLGLASSFRCQLVGRVTSRQKQRLRDIPVKVI